MTPTRGAAPDRVRHPRFGGNRLRPVFLLFFLTALALAAPSANAGSTEPELAIADVSASVHDSVVTLAVRANFSYGDVIRLGRQMTETVAKLQRELPVGVGIDAVSDQPKVVFCTTENDMAHIRAALEAGADEYVMKPFDRETLHIKLQLVGVA